MWSRLDVDNTRLRQEQYNNGFYYIVRFKCDFALYFRLFKVVLKILLGFLKIIVYENS